jgi:hypothetical protein
VTTRALAITLMLVASGAARAGAQTSAGESGRFEVAVGPLWIGSASFGERLANETTANGNAQPLFTTTTVLDATAAIELRFGVRLTQRIDAEAIGSLARPTLVATVRSDLEAGPGPFVAEEQLRQFSIGGALVWRLRPLRQHPRWTPFVTGGLQYERQLHETQMLLDDGWWYEAGGGVKYVIRSRADGAVKSIGVRGDVRAIVRTAGIDVDGRAHASPAIGASFYLRF